MRLFPALKKAIAFTLPAALILGSAVAQAEDKPTTTTTTTTTTSTGSGHGGTGLGAGKAEFDDFNFEKKGTNPKGPSGQATGQSSGQGAHTSGGGGHK